MHDLPQAASTQERSIKMGYRKGRWLGIGAGAERKTVRASGRWNLTSRRETDEPQRRSGTVRRLAAPDSATWLDHAEGDRNLTRGVSPPGRRSFDLRGRSNRSGDRRKRAGDSRRLEREDDDAEAMPNQHRPPLKCPGKNQNTQASGTLEIGSRRNECGSGPSQYGCDGSGHMIFVAGQSQERAGKSLSNERVFASNRT